jgi:hypothetical protein
VAEPANGQIEVLTVAHSSEILLLDDGELDDVQEILEELGVDFARVRGGAIAPNTPAPKSLLVATPRRIPSPSTDTSEDQPVRIVIVNEDSNKLREKLREVGFDFLVRRPVHPEALRLLIMHSLYRGEERRGEPRVAVGLEVSFRTGVLARRATLVDLSSRGCRLLSSYTLEPDRKIRLQVPESLGASEPFTIDGRILRTVFDERLGTGGMYSAAVEFQDLSNEARRELDWIIEDKAGGPPALRDASGLGSEWLDAEEEETTPPLKAQAKMKLHRPARSKRTILERVSPNCKPDPRTEGSGSPPPPDATPRPELDAELDAKLDGQVSGELAAIPVDVKMAPIQDDPNDQADQAADQSESPNERRSTERHPFEAKVPAFGTRALRVLVGRDLSVGGMRIASHPDLEVGDRLHLAIYGAAGEEPFLIWGTIARSDGHDGMGVVFDTVHSVVAEKLEKLLASLPAVESLHDDETAAMGTVMSEILDD